MKNVGLHTDKNITSFAQYKHKISFHKSTWRIQVSIKTDTGLQGFFTLSNHRHFLVNCCSDEACVIKQGKITCNSKLPQQIIIFIHPTVYHAS